MNSDASALSRSSFKLFLVGVVGAYALHWIAFRIPVLVIVVPLIFAQVLGQ